MKKLSTLMIAAIFALFGGLAMADNHEGGEGEEDMTMSDQTIVDVVTSNEDFSTLATAVTEASLVETLQGEGPFTVFAPTNAAFEQVEGLEDLLAQPETLRSILLYHVVPGELMAEDVVAAIEEGGGEAVVETAAGESISVTITMMDGNVMVDDATVVTTDIDVANGVIHVIDTVLTPTAPQAEEDSEASTGSTY